MSENMEEIIKVKFNVKDGLKRLKKEVDKGFRESAELSVERFGKAIEGIETKYKQVPFNNMLINIDREWSKLSEKERQTGKLDSKGLKVFVSTIQDLLYAYDALESMANKYKDKGIFNNLTSDQVYKIGDEYRQSVAPKYEEFENFKKIKTNNRERKKYINNVLRQKYTYNDLDKYTSQVGVQEAAKDFSDKLKQYINENPSKFKDKITSAQKKNIDKFSELYAVFKKLKDEYNGLQKRKDEGDEAFAARRLRHALTMEFLQDEMKKIYEKKSFISGENTDKNQALWKIGVLNPNEDIFENNMHKIIADKMFSELINIEIEKKKKSAESALNAVYKKVEAHSNTNINKRLAKGYGDPKKSSYFGEEVEKEISSREMEEYKISHKYEGLEPYLTSINGILSELSELNKISLSEDFKQFSDNDLKSIGMLFRRLEDLKQYGFEYDLKDYELDEDRLKYMLEQYTSANINNDLISKYEKYSERDEYKKIYELLQQRNAGEEIDEKEFLSRLAGFMNSEYDKKNPIDLNLSRLADELLGSKNGRKYYDESGERNTGSESSYNTNNSEKTTDRIMADEELERIRSEFNSIFDNANEKVREIFQIFSSETIEAKKDFEKIFETEESIKKLFDGAGEKIKQEIENAFKTSDNEDAIIKNIISEEKMEQQLSDMKTKFLEVVKEIEQELENGFKITLNIDKELFENNIKEIFNKEYINKMFNIDKTNEAATQDVYDEQSIENTHSDTTWVNKYMLSLDECVAKLEEIRNKSNKTKQDMEEYLMYYKRMKSFDEYDEKVDKKTRIDLKVDEIKANKRAGDSDRVKAFEQYVDGQKKVAATNTSTSSATSQQSIEPVDLSKIQANAQEASNAISSSIESAFSELEQKIIGIFDKIKELSKQANVDFTNAFEINDEIKSSLSKISSIIKEEVETALKNVDIKKSLSDENSKINNLFDTESISTELSKITDILTNTITEFNTKIGSGVDIPINLQMNTLKTDLEKLINSNKIHSIIESSVQEAIHKVANDKSLKDEIRNRAEKVINNRLMKESERLANFEEEDDENRRFYQEKRSYEERYEESYNAYLSQFFEKGKNKETSINEIKDDLFNEVSTKAERVREKKNALYWRHDYEGLVKDFELMINSIQSMDDIRKVYDEVQKFSLKDFYLDKFDSFMTRFEMDSMENKYHGNVIDGIERLNGMARDNIKDEESYIKMKMMANELIELMSKLKSFDNKLTTSYNSVSPFSNYGMYEGQDLLEKFNSIRNNIPNIQSLEDLNKAEQQYNRLSKFISNYETLFKKVHDFQDKYTKGDSASANLARALSKQLFDEMSNVKDWESVEKIINKVVEATKQVQNVETNTKNGFVVANKKNDNIDVDGRYYEDVRNTKSAEDEIRRISGEKGTLKSLTPVMKNESEKIKRYVAEIEDSAGRLQKVEFKYDSSNWMLYMKDDIAEEEISKKVKSVKDKIDKAINSISPLSKYGAITGNDLKDKFTGIKDKLGNVTSLGDLDAVQKEFDRLNSFIKMYENAIKKLDKISKYKGGTSYVSTIANSYFDDIYNKISESETSNNPLIDLENAMKDIDEAEEVLKKIESNAKNGFTLMNKQTKDMTLGGLFDVADLSEDEALADIKSHLKSLGLDEIPEISKVLQSEDDKIKKYVVSIEKTAGRMQKIEFRFDTSKGLLFRKEFEEESTGLEERIGKILEKINDSMTKYMESGVSSDFALKKIQSITDNVIDSTSKDELNKYEKELAELDAFVSQYNTIRKKIDDELRKYANDNSDAGIYAKEKLGEIKTGLDTMSTVGGLQELDARMQDVKRSIKEIQSLSSGDFEFLDKTSKNETSALMLIGRTITSLGVDLRNFSEETNGATASLRTYVAEVVDASGKIKKITFNYSPETGKTAYKIDNVEGTNDALRNNIVKAHNKYSNHANIKESLSGLLTEFDKATTINEIEQVRSKFAAIEKVIDEYERLYKKVDEKILKHSTDDSTYNTYMKGIFEGIKNDLDVFDINGENGLDDITVAFNKALQSSDSLKKIQSGNFKLFDTAFPNQDAVISKMNALTEILGTSVKELAKDTKQSSEDINVYTAQIVDNFGEIQNVIFKYDKNTGHLSSYVERELSPLEKYSQSLKQEFSRLATYWTATFLDPYDIIYKFRELLSIVTELDDAFVEMKKVSNENDVTLTNYAKSTFDTANKLGTTGLDLQTSTADYMRLGKSLTDAAKLAQDTTMLMNVSEFDDVNAATESMIAMTQAYQELDSMEIIDKLNNIGNNFSISTADLASSLQRSASALQVSGNDINEAMALTVAGNSIVQDPDSVAAGIRTISLRITGTEDAKKQLEEEGENVEDFVLGTKSKIDESVRNLTAVASNGFKGVSLLGDDGTYRSTYEILQDIADVWDEIKESDHELGTNKSNALLEMLAGKNRSNILASILSDADLLREAYESAQNSVGSASAEHEKYMDSISGKTNQLKNQLQEFAAVSIDSGGVKTVLDILEKTLEVITAIIDKTGGLSALIGVVGTIFGKMNGLDKIKSYKKMSLSLRLHYNAM